MSKDFTKGNIDYLDSERIKLWERVTQLEIDVSKKTSDFEKEAKQSSKMASEYKNRSLEAKEQATSNAELSLARTEDAKQCLTDIKLIKTKSEQSFKNIDDFDKNLKARTEHIEDTLTTLEENFENNESLLEKLETLQEHFDKGDEISGKIDTLYKSLQSKKREIDNLHREIFGYTESEINEEGNEIETKVEGLKDELENTYESLQVDLNELQEEVETVKKDTIDGYNTFLKEKTNDYNETLSGWNLEHNAVLDKINKLLPNALTAGLSSAYSEKKDSEVNDSKKFTFTFRFAALGLAMVSLIPFGLSIYFILQKRTIIEVIEYSPRFVLAIIPLYIPILWIAYSANKKLNLSKRLIEEYTHKEVLSKTFEGLSHQINSIEDKEISSDLRIKLLYNILSVSSENPGKLISDYNKSDHPLMDALEKSANLSDAVEKLENIPGLSKIARILDNKSKEILKEQAKKVDSTLGQIVEEVIEP
ncbi:hypothetical protein CLU83_3514 [Flavobacterium sp. 1]|uniref:hypothetical protein n=1 Tax=Flavobacterium sp. 1 TaxID=2035200 RepID=UPI000C234BE4|nr:hypothetical protein [Flavobacterium sp. 1]PJJ10123.1 hypothetical protein CLU83_3514 [Flavobacterium sp. 1]